MDWPTFILIFSLIAAGGALIASGYLLYQSVLDRRALDVTGQNGALKTLAWTLIVAEGLRFVKLVLLLAVMALAFYLEPTEFLVVRRLLIVAVIGLISAGSIHGSISRRVLTDAMASEFNKEQSAAALAKLTALTANSVDVQLKQIHALVNSDMTAARQSELIAIEAHLHTLRRGTPTEEELGTIEALEVRADELREIIADRNKKQAQADKAADES